MHLSFQRGTARQTQLLTHGEADTNRKDHLDAELRYLDTQWCIHSSGMDVWPRTNPRLLCLDVDFTLYSDTMSDPLPLVFLSAHFFCHLIFYVHVYPTPTQQVSGCIVPYHEVVTRRFCGSLPCRRRREGCLCKEKSHPWR